MKSFKRILVVFVILVSTQIYAQTPPKYYLVLVKANWCATCQKNEDRVVNEVLSKVDTDKFLVLTRDMTNIDTRASSLEIMRTHHLEYVKLRSTGMLFFVDTQTKEIVESTSISKSNSEILKTINRVSSL